MGKLTKDLIVEWVKNSERFEARGDGDNLWIRYRAQDLYPRWFLRYSLDGRSKVLHLGSYRDISLSEARATAKKLRAQIALGFDVAEQKKDRIKAATERNAARLSEFAVGNLADMFYVRYIDGRWKNPGIVRSWIDNRIKPAIGRIPLSEIKSAHIDALLGTIARDAPSTATKILGCLKKMFNFAVKLGKMQSNPASIFDSSDAGGRMRPRSRWLSAAEICQLMTAMDVAKGWTIQNTLAVRLLLMLAVRKSELIQARVSEFDLSDGIWRIPASRTKSNREISIPLPAQAVVCVRALIQLAGGSEWLFPARKMQSRLAPFISADTINAALGKV